jgi:hypothetical protein
LGKSPSKAAGVRYSGSRDGQQVGISKPSRTPSPFSFQNPWRLAELELLQLFQNKKVIVEKAGCRIQGTLTQAPSCSRLILSTVEGPVLMRDWDVIKEVK